MLSKHAIHHVLRDSAIWLLLVALCSFLSSAAAVEPISADEPAEATQSQTEVDRRVEDETTRLHEGLIENAVTALDETRNALAVLGQGDTESALASLETVIGKLEMVVARNPDLALAPVNVSTSVYDLYADADTVREVLEEVRQELDDGNVQAARRLLRPLASETVLEVSYLPLARYSEAIKAVVPLIDAGRVQDATRELIMALNTIVVREEAVVPLPVTRARALLDEAEQLAEKKDRSEDENNQLAGFLDAAREQLRLAEILGYGRVGNFEEMHAQLDQIEAKTEGGKSGEGLFDRLKSMIDDWMG